jgi:hypothetical protein
MEHALVKVKIILFSSLRQMFTSIFGYNAALRCPFKAVVKPDKTILTIKSSFIQNLRLKKLEQFDRSNEVLAF